MRISVFCLGLFVAGAAALSAQQPLTIASGSPDASTLTLIAPAAPSACPAAWMRATQGSSSQLLRATDGRKPPINQPMMTPILTLTPRNGHVLASAMVTAHGLKPMPGAMDLVAEKVTNVGTRMAREIAKTLKVKLTRGENGSYSAMLELVGFTTVQSIHLDAVTYADGSTWTADTNQGCSVTPDPFLLIGNN